MRKTLAVRLCAGALALAGAWIALTQQPQAPPPLKLNQVKSDLYEIEGDGGNVAVYLTSEGVILIDDKFPRDVQDIVAKVKSLTDKPIKYVLNTHQHGDHTGGNEQLLASAEIIIQRNARANMVTNKQPGLPRVTFSEESAVYLGGKEVLARHFGRGHTNGDAVIYFPAERTVHMGDLFVSSAPFIDYSAHGSGLEWAHTIDEALKWDFDTVIPGHGPVSTRADLIAFRNKIQTFVNRTADLVHEGRSKEEVAKLVQIDDLGWQRGGFWQRTIDGLCDEISKR